MARVFGVASTAGGITAGLLQTVEVSGSAKIAETRDANGLVKDEQAYSRVVQVKVDFVQDSGDTVPAAGASVTAASVTGLVTDVSVTESNTAHKSGSYTIQKSDSATQVALA